eukprot:TRINITY_DN6411_c0_g1_i3.p1 TRINITY_DN6411_c0_g1~~TRINITY_DN6411_c0_g1_i3.p1  ORF type:complete len:316 (+),score=13.58 TRINITY_DN6411_c0_g1_i3:116-1063(+)
MELNSFVFPSSKASYSYEDLPNNLVFIPRAPIINGKSAFDAPTQFSSKEPKHIPCLYISSEHPSSKLLVYFHGNAEDVGQTCGLLETLSNYLNVHVLAMEYPSYGIYPGQPSEKRILEDCTNVYDYLTLKAKWKPSNTIIAGRSIGSGPSIHLASYREACALLLISAYTSVKAVAKNIAGSLLQALVKDRFKNKELMGNVTCPVFILHGMKDTVVPYSHAQELLAECKGPCFLSMPEYMDHCTMEYSTDLCKPFGDFLNKCGVTTSEIKGITEPYFPDEMFSLPKEYPLVEAPGIMKKFILKLICACFLLSFLRY